MSAHGWQQYNQVTGPCVRLCVVASGGIVAVDHAPICVAGAKEDGACAIRAEVDSMCRRRWTNDVCR